MPMSKYMQERCFFYFDNEFHYIWSISSTICWFHKQFQIHIVDRKEQMEKEFAKPVISESERWFKNAMLVGWQKCAKTTTNQKQKLKQPNKQTSSRIFGGQVLMETFWWKIVGEKYFWKILSGNLLVENNFGRNYLSESFGGNLSGKNCWWKTDDGKSLPGMSSCNPIVWHQSRLQGFSALCYPLPVSVSTYPCRLI